MPGLKVDTTTGVISGTPTTPWTTSVTISATNAGGTGTAALVITINVMPVITSMQVTPDFCVVNQQITATGGAAVSSGGVRLSWDFGDGSPTVTGASVPHTYTAAGNYVVTLTATADGGQTVSQALGVTVSMAIGSSSGGGSLPPGATLVGSAVTAANGKAALVVNMAAGKSSASTFTAQVNGIAFPASVTAQSTLKSGNLTLATGATAYTFRLDPKTGKGTGLSTGLNSLALSLKKKTLTFKIAKDPNLNGLISALPGWTYTAPQLKNRNAESSRLGGYISVTRITT